MNQAQLTALVTDREVAALRTTLAIRERELREIKGPCSYSQCRLHLAHNGPCDIRLAAR